MNLPDPRPGAEAGHGEAPEGDDQGRVQRLELARQVRRAGGDLIGLRIPVAGRAALDHVGDEDLLARPQDRREQLVEERPGLADERPALPVLVETRTFAHEDDLGCGRPLPRHGPCPTLVQAAARARRDLRPYCVERRLALDVPHEASPAPFGAARRERAFTQPRSRRVSAISTAFVAAPLRRLSLTTQKAMPRWTEGSVRTRPTYTSSVPAAWVAIG